MVVLSWGSPSLEPSLSSSLAAGPSHVAIEPSIIYPGTPVALLSTCNPDGSANLAPMSSFWALGWSAMLGVAVAGQTYGNLCRTGECVINLVDAGLWQAVERLAPLTGRDPPAPHLRAYGGRFVPDKFAAAGLTPMPSERVGPPRVGECSLQLEARVVALHPLQGEEGCAAVETRVLRVHAAPGILKSGGHHVDPARWRPLLYSFRRYFGLGPELGRSFRES